MSRSRKTKLLVAGGLMIIASMLLTLGALGLYSWYRATHEPAPAISSSVVTHSTETPSETPPTKACENYQVAADHPRKIDIPSIGASGCIEKVGIDQHGAIAVPTNIYLAGWYVNSALPGEKGLSIIDGHISGRYSETAIFQHLAKLKAGDTFTVTRGDGEKLNYKVLETTTVPVEQAMDVLMAQEEDVESQLNLITCGGKYDKETKLYDKRVIVSGELLES